jgi:peroxiredoxin
VLNQSLPEFHRYGAQLVAITPQKPDKSAEQFRQKAYPFIVLSDLDNSVMQAYRLFYKVDPKLVNLYKNKFGLDLEEFNGPGRTVLPVPGTFVIDRQGIVRARHADTDYTKRMEPADIIQALKKL